jgi:hypothetical protein
VSELVGRFSSAECIGLDALNSLGSGSLWPYQESMYPAYFVCVIILSSTEYTLLSACLVFVTLEDMYLCGVYTSYTGSFSPAGLGKDCSWTGCLLHASEMLCMRFGPFW